MSWFWHHASEARAEALRELPLSSSFAISVDRAVAEEVGAQLVAHQLSDPTVAPAPIGDGRFRFMVRAEMEDVAASIAATVRKHHVGGEPGLLSLPRGTYRLGPSEDPGAVVAGSRELLFHAQNRSRKRPRRGDVFVYSYDDELLRWGIVADDAHPTAGGVKHTVLWFMKVATRTEDLSWLDSDLGSGLLCPPVFGDRGGWSSGAFRTVRSSARLNLPSHHPVKRDDGRCIGHDGSSVDCPPWAIDGAIHSIVDIDEMLALAWGLRPSFRGLPGGKYRPVARSVDPTRGG